MLISCHRNERYSSELQKRRTVDTWQAKHTRDSFAGEAWTCTRRGLATERKGDEMHHVVYRKRQSARQGPRCLTFSPERLRSLPRRLRLELLLASTRWPKMAPRWPQGGSKMADMAPRWSQDAPKTAPRCGLEADLTSSYQASIRGNFKNSKSLRF